MILKKVRELKNIFKTEDKDSYNEILGWEKQVEKYTRLKELADTDAVQEVIQDFQMVVKACDKELLTNRELSVENRDRIFERRDNYQYFINLFQSAAKNLDSLEKQIDENLYG